MKCGKMGVGSCVVKGVCEARGACLAGGGCARQEG